MHHIFLLYDANDKAECADYFAALSKRMQNASSVRFTLHYKDSFRIAKFLPRHKNLLLKPYQIVPTVDKIQKLASRLPANETKEIVNLMKTQTQNAKTSAENPLRSDALETQTQKTEAKTLTQVTKTAKDGKTQTQVKPTTSALDRSLREALTIQQHPELALQRDAYVPPPPLPQFPLVPSGSDEVLPHNVVKRDPLQPFAYPTAPCLSNKQLHLRMKSLPNWFDGSRSGKTDCLISLTAIPTRILHQEFERTLATLCEGQRLQPKRVILNVCETYRRNFTYNRVALSEKLRLLQHRFPLLYVHTTEDMGPATKLLGLHDLPSHVADLQRCHVVVVDDDFAYDDTMTMFHTMALQLYQADFVGLDERAMVEWGKISVSGFTFANNGFRRYSDIFYDHYSGYLFGWMSFCVRGSLVRDARAFYLQKIQETPEIVSHDDLLFTLYYLDRKLYGVGMRMFFNEGGRPGSEEVDALRLLPAEHSKRSAMEKKCFQQMGYTHQTLTDYARWQPRQIAASVGGVLPPRYMLRNVANWSYPPGSTTHYQTTQFDLKYIGSHTLAVTVTCFDKPPVVADPNDETQSIIRLVLRSPVDRHGVFCELFLPWNRTSSTRKATFFVDFTLDRLQPEPWDTTMEHLSLFQTAASIHTRCHLSICTLLNCLPHLSYRFFDDSHCLHYITHHYPPQVLDLYNRLKPPSYRADLFRALYLWEYGGLYADCKMVMFSSMRKQLTDRDNLYVRDSGVLKGTYNALMFERYPRSEILRKYLGEAFYNITFQQYGENQLHVTGPCILYRHASTLDCQLIKFHLNNDWQESSFVREASTNQILFKSSYYGYYREEKNQKMHYSRYYEERNVFHHPEPLYKKIDGVSKIVWINLDRCEARRKKMEAFFQHLPTIRNQRISAVHDELETIDFDHFIGRSKMSKREIACTLSHLKAITDLRDAKGEWFLVCEDDLEFETGTWFQESLSEILANAPEDAEIVKLHTLHIGKEPKPLLYTPWCRRFPSTTAYAIRNTGVKRITDHIRVNASNQVTIPATENLCEADMYIYTLARSYEYKYNFFDPPHDDSTIHQQHMQWHKMSKLHNFNMLVWDRILAFKDSPTQTQKQQQVPVKIERPPEVVDPLWQAYQESRKKQKRAALAVNA